MDNDSESTDWDAREKLFDKALDHRGSVYYTYQRNYFAAKYFGWFGWTLDAITALFGAVLIYILQQNISGQTSVYIAIGILTTSLISSLYAPKLRSRDYYNAGQRHQVLYDKFDHFIQLDVSDPEVTNQELREKLQELNDQRHELNQSTPQLGGIWYYSMKLSGKLKWAYTKVVPWKEERNWEREKYEDIVFSINSTFCVYYIGNRTLSYDSIHHTAIPTKTQEVWK